MNHDFTLPSDKPKKHKKPNANPNSSLKMDDVKYLVETFRQDATIGEIQWKDFSIKRAGATVISAPVTGPAAVAQPIQSVETPTNATEVASKSKYHEITSPMVGTCYLAPSPEAENFAEINSVVKAGDTLCLIEAMKMFNKIKADVSGTIKRRLIEDGEPVEFGQPLFEIDETGA